MIPPAPRRPEPPRLVWIDANVILRLLTDHPAEQADVAEALVRRADNGEVRLFVCSIVVAEVAWVLMSSYGFSIAAATKVLLNFLASDGVVVDEGPLVNTVLHTMAATGVDYADAVVAVRARLTGAPVASFDRDFDKLGVERFDLTPR